MILHSARKKEYLIKTATEEYFVAMQNREAVVK